MRYRIKELRERAEMSQTQLADRTGISAPYLSQLETGSAKKNPSIDALTKIAAALRVPVGDIFVGGGMAEPDAAPFAVDSNRRAEGPATRALQAARGLRRPALYTARRAAPGFDVRRDDFLVVELAPSRPDGRLVLCTAADEDTGAATTLLRRCVETPVGRLLLSDDPLAEDAVRFVDAANNPAILGVVHAVVRN